jgi:DNA-binding response OmpR family regulator
MASNPSDSTGVRVLLVEDEVAIRRATTAALESLGHTVDAASELDAAQALLGENTYDLALVDLNLRGGHGGFVLMRHMGHHEISTPIVVISSTTSHEDILAAFRLGVTDFVQKPVRTSELICVVARVLKKRAVAANALAANAGAASSVDPAPAGTPAPEAASDPVSAEGAA